MYVRLINALEIDEPSTSVYPKEIKHQSRIFINVGSDAVMTERKAIENGGR